MGWGGRHVALGGPRGGGGLGWLFPLFIYSSFLYPFLSNLSTTQILNECTTKSLFKQNTHVFQHDTTIKTPLGSYFTMLKTDILYNKTTLQYSRKKEKQVKERVTLEFGGY
jgi:hypothetical protein